MEEIKIENLAFSYPESDFFALSNVNLSFKKGKFYLICGKSGCGKSTLLRLIKNSNAPFGKKIGNIYFEGRNAETLSEREQAEKIGFVYQNPDNQIVCDKVWHELAFGLESLSYPKNEIRMRVCEMASFFGMQDWFYDDVSHLSGGQKQLLNLASVMVMRPSVLILDEPTSMLDPIAAHDFIETVLRINKELGTTVIMSEHRLEEVFPIADGVVVLDEGSVLANASSKDVAKAIYEQKNDMFSALPTPMRVYFKSGMGGKCPIDVREGRKWLFENFDDEKNIKNIEFDFENKENTLGKNMAMKVSDVYFRYEKNLCDVLKKTCLEIYENEALAIVGANAAGKSTLLSVMSGIYAPQRGKVKIFGGKKVIMIPQNVQSIFTQKSVISELKNAAGKNIGEEKALRLEKIIKFFGLSDVLERHPYDLSGGQQQKLALALAMTKEGDILLLDEPTKGIDAHFKDDLASLFAYLKNQGITIVLVSHDIEFCARYSDRCALFFDGKIVSEDFSKRFFDDKCFYTTAASRMSKDIINHAVLDEDILFALGKEDERKNAECKNYKEKKDLPSVSDFNINENGKNEKDELIKKADKTNCPKKTEKEKPKIPMHIFLTLITVMILVPLTIYAGIHLFSDRKYYFISLCIILETIITFVFSFESQKPGAKMLVLISVMCACAVLGRVVFSPFEQFKPIAAIVMITGICFGCESGFLVGAVSAFLSNFFFSQGPWTPWQMFALGVLGFISGIFFYSGFLPKKKTTVCIFGFLTTLFVYGIIMNYATAVMSQAYVNWSILKAYLISGFVFDLIHAFSTVFFLWFGFESVSEKLERVKIKYGIDRN